MKIKLLICLLIIAGLTACRKTASDTQQEVIQQTDELTIEQVKKHYLNLVENPREVSEKTPSLSSVTKSYVSPIQARKQANARFLLGMYDEKPQMDWDNYYKNDFVKGYPVILVPVKSTDLNRSFLPDMNPNGYRVVAFQHNTDKSEIKSNIQEIHPDKEYLKRKALELALDSAVNDYSSYRQLIDTKDFSGYILLYNMDDQLLAIHHAKDGHYDKLYKPKTN